MYVYPNVFLFVLFFLTNMITFNHLSLSLYLYMCMCITGQTEMNLGEEERGRGGERQRGGRRCSVIFSLYFSNFRRETMLSLRVCTIQSPLQIPSSPPDRTPRPSRNTLSLLLLFRPISPPNLSPNPPLSSPPLKI